METFEQYRLINQKQWTDFLKGLQAGESTFTLPTIADIHSLKSVAYKLNSDRLGRKYSIRADKEKKVVVINVTIL